MASQLQEAVRAVLRESGPLTIDEILDRVTARHSINTMKSSVRNAVTNDPLCYPSSRGYYVYLPVALQGAQFRVPMELTVPTKGELVVGTEVMTGFWPAYEHQRTPRKG